MGPSLSASPSGWLQPAENKIYTLAKMETIPLPLFLPPSICTCKLLAFSCNMEITQMVIILRKTFAFCIKASSLGKLWRDFCMAFLSPVTYWQKFEKKVSLPRKAEQRSAARAWWPWCLWFISWGFWYRKGKKILGTQTYFDLSCPAFHCFYFCTVQSDYVSKNYWHFW